MIPDPKIPIELNSENVMLKIIRMTSFGILLLQIRNSFQISKNNCHSVYNKNINKTFPQTEEHMDI